MPANLQLPTVSVRDPPSPLSSVFSPTRVSPTYPSFYLKPESAAPPSCAPLASPETETDSEDDNDGDSYIGASVTSLFRPNGVESPILRDQAARRRVKSLKIVVSQRKASHGGAIHKHPNAIPSFRVSVHHARDHAQTQTQAQAQDSRAGTFAPYHHVLTPHPSPHHLDGEKTPVQLTPRTARPAHGASAAGKRCAGH